MRITQTDPDEIIARRIAAEVRAEMARQEMSQQALSDLLGWPQPRLSRRITSGKTSVAFTVVELAAVARALNVAIEQFLPPITVRRQTTNVA